jgi:hypothetical protein
MNMIELSKKDGQRFLLDFDSGWEIYDNGSAPALWSNYTQSRNLDSKQTYEEIRKSVYGSMMPSTIKDNS